MMIEPKELIFDQLEELKSDFTGLVVYQVRPEVIESFPSLTFYISSNVPEYDLDKEIEMQNITVVVDIWANTSEESGMLLVALEAKMKEIDYLLSFNSDILDPEGYSHLTTQFIY